jgi:methylglyoxal synthase
MPGLLAGFPLVATGKTGQPLYKEAEIALAKTAIPGLLGVDESAGHTMSAGNICRILFFQ